MQCDQSDSTVSVKPSKPGPTLDIYSKMNVFRRVPMDSGWVPVLSPGAPTIYTSTLTVIMPDQEQFSIQYLAQHLAILIAKV